MRSLYQDVIGYFIGSHYLSPLRILFHSFSLNGNVGRPIQIGSVNHPPMPLPILIFSFYHDGITFESFMPAFSDWYSNHQPCAMMIGIRTDESYTRFWAIASKRKHRFADDKPWTTGTISGHTYNIYPIYDWKTDDIWTYFSSTKKSTIPCMT